ncbi:MAG: divergent polysaccharide deacetylase family protein [Pseudomonadota bacterium]
MIRALGAVLLLTFFPLPAFAEPPRIAIIIDDLGYRLNAGRRAVELPGAVAVAVLPATPRGSALASYAHEQGKEILVHLPLEAIDHRRDEPIEIRQHMDQCRFLDTFSRALAAVPNATGVSTHQGSLLTQDADRMRWLMTAMAEQPSLYFVDSYTTHESVALAAARDAGVPARRRDVFLDHDRSESALEQQFARLLELARRNGVAIGVGHPYVETLSFLEHKLTTLDEFGVELVTVREVVTVMNSETQADSKTAGAQLGTLNAK